MPTATPTPLRVFLSYSWDSPEHKQRVLELAQRLRADGVDARMDRFTTFPEEGWPRWMENEIEHAAFVVVVATPKYAERFAGHAPAGMGLGATWEGAIVTQDLYESGVRNRKFLPVIFSDADGANIPKPLRSFMRYRVDSEEGYLALYRQITGQPEIVPVALGAMRDLPSGTGVGALPPLAPVQIHDHAAARSNLPRLPYGFFGREEELQTIASALEPQARTWGALIDGPGGMGKTALAIRAAEQTPPGQFQRIIFLSAKSSELTPDGQRALSNFVTPAYREMLTELAREIDVWDEAKTKDEKERPALLQRALQNERALLIFDNLESLPADDRDRLFDFLSRLPRACKAIVTSRRRSDVDARVLRLDKLGRGAALQFIAELARDRKPLRLATEGERAALYENTGGNPLLIRWIAGQLGRGQCRTVATALDLLRNAPADNDPLEFIFGDLADTFTESETQVLAALCHFTLPVEVRFIAELSGLQAVAAQTASENLTDRALVISDSEARRFVLMPLVAAFLRRARPEAVRAAGDRLTGRAYALAVEDGYAKHDHFPVLEAAWPTVAAALPLFLQGSNDPLQTVCYALGTFLDFSGHWDERLSLSLQAEGRAVAAKDFDNAGWRAYDAGWIHYLRGQSEEVLACAERASAYWREAKAGARERAYALRLRGTGYQLAKDYPAAITAYDEAVELWRSLSRESEDVAMGLNDRADVEYLAGDLAGAERDHREALRIAKALGDSEGVAAFTGNLAQLALNRKDWAAAEALASEALALAEKLGRKDLVAEECANLAQALAHQNRKPEALPYAQRSVDLYTQLRSRSSDGARRILDECQS